MSWAKTMVTYYGEVELYYLHQLETKWRLAQHFSWHHTDERTGSQLCVVVWSACRHWRLIGGMPSLSGIAEVTSYGSSSPVGMDWMCLGPGAHWLRGTFWGTHVPVAGWHSFKMDGSTPREARRFKDYLSETEDHFYKSWVTRDASLWQWFGIHECRIQGIYQSQCYSTCHHCTHHLMAWWKDPYRLSRPPWRRWHHGPLRR